MSFLEKIIRNKLAHYDHNKFWKMYYQVVNPLSKTPLFLKWIYLIKLKKSERYNNAVLGI